MQTKRIMQLAALGAVAALLAAPALAQQRGSIKLTSTEDRLFDSFIEDATIVESQWWEGQIFYEDFDDLGVKRTAIRGIAAFQPWRDWEVGVRVGFGDSDVDSPLIDDGTGATDLEAWAKYYLGIVGDNTEFVVGGTATVPTGDDSVGLGFDAFAISGFGSMRYRMNSLVITATAGAQFNQDGRIFGVDIDGEVSPFIAGGVLVPVSDEVTFVGEARFAGERFDGSDSVGQLTAGVNLRVFERGQMRAALGLGLSDGSPDLSLIVGYATTF